MKNGVWKIAALAVLAIVLGTIWKLGIFAGPSSAPVSANLSTRLLNDASNHFRGLFNGEGPALPRTKENTLEIPLAEFLKVPNWECKAYLGWRFPSLQKKQREEAFQMVHQVYSQIAVARHLEGTNKLLVVTSTKEKHPEEILQLALVHELAKLVLEKRYQLLDRKYDPHSLEEFRIYQAVVEGRAQWVTREVAKRLGTEKFFPQLAQRWIEIPEFAIDSQQRTILGSVFQQKQWAYTRGLAFWDFLEKNGKGNVEKQVFHHLPQQIAQIENPQLYLTSGLTQQQSLKEVMQSLNTAELQAGWVGRMQTWTPSDCQQVAALFGLKSRAYKATRDWQEGRVVYWTPKDRPGVSISVSVVRFKSDSAARSYYGFCMDLQRKRDELSGKQEMPGLPVFTQSRYTPISIAGMDKAARYDRRQQAGGSELPLTMVFARAGNVVFHLTWHNYRADLEWGQGILELIRSKI